MADIDDLDNLFEEYESRSRPEGAEVLSADEAAVPEVNEGVEENAPERVPVPIRRIVRNPRLKFNPDRLCGDRGIPILPKHFKNVKFKGKGHEKEDLDKLLSTLNHWCHRLFPSMKFEDCLRQIEKLGKKRPVQTCLHKIRHDMPILSNDFVGDEVEVEREGDEAEMQGDVETNAEDAFDRLLNETSDHAPANFTSTPIRQQATGNILGTSFGSTLTEEQRKRIEYNRTLAIERRKNKLAAMQSSTLEVNLDHPSSSCVVDLEPSDLEKNNASFENAVEDSEVQSQKNSDSYGFSYHEENQNNIVKNSEELDMDELMDLVNDDNLENMPVYPSVDHVSEPNCKPNSLESLNSEYSTHPVEMSDSAFPESDEI